MYRRPEDLGQALAVLASHRPMPLAGGTDVYPARVGRPPDSDLLDLSRIAALRGIVAQADGWRIGALTTWTDVVRAGLPPALDALVQAAVEVGGPQVQNRGTVGGNLCNASPAADGVPVLLALDASVELASVRGTRRLPLGEFVVGPRRTARAPDELLVAVHLPRAGDAARSRFAKLGHRRYLVISIAMVAVALDLDARGRAERVGIAVGSCGPVAARLGALESRLVGLTLDEMPVAAARSLREEPGAMLAPLSPIDDVRGSARYRLDAAATLVRRTLTQVCA